MKATQCLKKTLLTGTALAMLASAAVGCAKDESPPVIQNHGIFQNDEEVKWVVEDENVELEVNTLDDTGVEEVYVQFGSAEPISLTKVYSEKNEVEEAEWKAGTNLPAKEYGYTIVAKDKNNETKVEGAITVYPEDADEDGLSYREELKYGTDPNKKNPVAKYLLGKNLAVYIPELLVLDEDGVMDDSEKAFIDVLPVMDEEFAGYVIENKLTFGDGSISELELNFLTEPDKYTKQLFDQYISDVAENSPELANELKKLPDFEQIEIKDVEATEDILSSMIKHEKFLEYCMNEGIKNKRKYCSHLEALVWIAYDEELDYMHASSSEATMYYRTQYAWTSTTTSKNYKSDRWKNFDEVVDRLNSPDSVSIYMRDNISYDYELVHTIKKTGVYVWHNAKKTFEMKKGICSGHSILALYFLLNNGYNYNNFDVHKDDAACVLLSEGKLDQRSIIQGHATCMYVENGNFYTIDQRRGNRIVGPFKTIKEAANDTWRNWYNYKFVDINAKITKTVYR